MRAGTFSSLAACATAAPWLPPEAATTPAAGTLRNSRLAKAPRALNEPDCCSSSSLRTMVMPSRPKSRPSTSTIGVRRMYRRITFSVASIWVRPTLEGLTEHPAGLGDALLVAAIEGPLLDPFRPDEPEPREDLEVFVRARLGDAQLVGDEDAAHSVLDQVTVDLGRKVVAGLFQPVENGKPAVAGQGRRQIAGKHLGSFLRDRK